MSFWETHIYLLHFELMLFIMFGAAFYMLMSQRNGFGAEEITDQRLRRQAGLLFLTLGLIYVVNIPVFMIKDLTTRQMLSMTIDLAVSFPIYFRFLFALLQDRRRWNDRLWMVLGAVSWIPLAGWMLSHSTVWLWLLIGVITAVVSVLLVLYLRAMRQYQAFLVDIFADLEHKEVMWSLVTIVMMVMMMVTFSIAWSKYSISMTYVFHLCHIALLLVICYRIDRQQVLEVGVETEEKTDEPEADAEKASDLKGSKSDDTIIRKIGMLLDKHCIEKGLYLQHDLSKDALAKACLTNRTYLSNYFAANGITYNTYINQLRIGHFMKLCHKAQETYGSTFYFERTKDTPTIKQLASESGFRHYNTFSRAFRAFTGLQPNQWLEQESHTENL